MSLLLLLACNPCDPDEPLETLREPWQELELPEGSSACLSRVYDGVPSTDLRRSASGDLQASMAALAEETALAFEAQGWSRREGAEGLSMVRGEQRTDLVPSAHSPSIAQVRLRLFDHFDREGLFPDWDATISAGRKAEKGLRTLSVEVPVPETCPEGLQVAGLIEKAQLEGDKPPEVGWATSAAFEPHVRFPGFGVDEILSKEAHDHRYAYAKALARPVAIAEVLEVSPAKILSPGFGEIKGSYESGLVLGRVLVVEGLTPICQTAFLAQNGEWDLGVNEHEDPEKVIAQDLETQTRYAMKDTAEKLVGRRLD